jgi:hypothetical protein
MFEDDTEIVEDKPTSCNCYWCGNDASLTWIRKDGILVKDVGFMYHMLYNKIICDECLEKHNYMLIMYHSGLRRDRRQPVFQLALL